MAGGYSSRDRKKSSGSARDLPMRIRTLLYWRVIGWSRHVSVSTILFALKQFSHLKAAEESAGRLADVNRDFPFCG